MVLEEPEELERKNRTLRWQRRVSGLPEPWVTWMAGLASSQFSQFTPQDQLLEVLGQLCRNRTAP
jgi:hypothetical protein